MVYVRAEGHRERVTSSFVTRFLYVSLEKPVAEGTDAHEHRIPAAAESDETLLSRICNGDQDALVLLFRRYVRAIQAISYRVLRDTAEVEDFVQDIFLSVNRNCQTFDSSKGPAKFWILQMAYRRAISRRRYLTTRHFYTRLDLDDAAAELADPRIAPRVLDDSIDGGLENGRLHRVFAELSADQKQTLRLFFIEGYTFDEIATKLGQTRGNVKNHYFRGLEKLRKALFGRKLPGERAV